MTPQKEQDSDIEGAVREFQHQREKLSLILTDSHGRCDAI